MEQLKTAKTSEKRVALGPVAQAAGRRRNLRVSYEFFPPKNEAMQKTLWASIKKLETLSPDFVSVTYGAGGTTRERTHETVAKIVQETTTNAAAHLTCVGATQSEIDEVAQNYWDAGVRHIVALRGDPESGISDKYIPKKGGYAYGSDLVAGLRRLAPFDVSVGAYPELHPESNGSWEKELDNLKRKVDAGASRAITQFFFEADTFLRFRDRVADAGIDVAVVPGLMLQPNYRGMVRMSDMCGIAVPNWYHELFADLDDEPDTRQLLTATTVAELTAGLHENGVNRFHFYTLNRSDLAFMVSKMLGVKAVRGAS